MDALRRKFNNREDDGLLQFMAQRNADEIDRRGRVPELNRRMSREEKIALDVIMKTNEKFVPYRKGKDK